MATYEATEAFYPAILGPMLGLRQKNSYSLFSRSGARSTTYTKLAEFTGGPYAIWYLGLDPDATYYYAGNMRLVIDGVTVRDARLSHLAGYNNALVGMPFSGLTPISTVQNPTGPCFAESSFEVWGKTLGASSAYYWDYRVHYAEVEKM